MDLEALLENTVDYTNVLIEAVISQSSLTPYGGTCYEIARYYRAMGIYDYLINFDIEGFFYGLIHSGLTRKHYLSQCQIENAQNEPQRMTSLVGPFFDAIASHQFKLAKDIARLSPDQWIDGAEYEDDFAYAYFFHVLVDDSNSSKLDDIVKQYEIALQGQASARFDVCRAFLSKDQQEFDESFAALLEFYDAYMSEVAAEGPSASRVLEYDFEANRRIFVEGLAILRLAEKVGLSTEEGYDLCPAPLRTTEYNFVPDSFPNIGLDD